MNMKIIITIVNIITERKKITEILTNCKLATELKKYKHIVSK